jgi:N-acetylneuraminic acid mutarotase
MKRISCLTLAFIIICAVQSGLGFDKQNAEKKDANTGSWKKMTGVAPIEPRALIGSLRAGNKLIVWGGEIKDSPVSDGAIYDLATDTWKKMTKAPIEGREHFAMLAYGNKVIIWGGKNTPAGAVYDIDKDSWKVMAKAPITRRNWSASVLLGNKLVIWGGCPGPVEAHTSGSQNDGAIYDIDEDAWRKMADAPLSPRFFSRGFVWGNKVVIWGGLKDQFFYDGAVYDLEKNAWEKISEPPLKGERPKELYSYGIFGYNPTPSDLAGDKLIVWSMHCNAIYDLAKKKWEEMAAGPISGRDYHASFLYGNKLLIWGGRDDKSAKADGAIDDIGR